MNSTDILTLELGAAEKEARDILIKEGIDPDKIGRHLFTGWPENKVYFADIGYLNPKLSDFNEAAHFAYRMLGAVILIRDMLKECKDDDELRRMTYLLNLGTFRELAEVGLNVPRARKYFTREFSGKGGKGKKGQYGPVRKLIEAVIRDLQAEGLSINQRNIKNKLIDKKYIKTLSDSFSDVILDIEEQTLSFGIPTDRGESFYVIKLSYLNKLISELRPK